MRELIKFPLTNESYYLFGTNVSLSGTTGGIAFVTGLVQTPTGAVGPLFIYSRRGGWHEAARIPGVGLGPGKVDSKGRMGSTGLRS